MRIPCVPLLLLQPPASYVVQFGFGVHRLMHICWQKQWPIQDRSSGVVAMLASAVAGPCCMQCAVLCRAHDSSFAAAACTPSSRPPVMCACRKQCGRRWGLVQNAHCCEQAGRRAAVLAADQRSVGPPAALWTAAYSALGAADKPCLPRSDRLGPPAFVS